jgi:hypothetical protein
MEPLIHEPVFVCDVPPECICDQLTENTIEIARLKKVSECLEPYLRHGNNIQIGGTEAPNLSRVGKAAELMSAVELMTC